MSSLHNSKIIFIIFMLIGTALTVWGFVHMPWPYVVRWWGFSALFRYISYWVGCAFLVGVGSYWSGRSPFYVGSLLGFVVALVSGSLWPFFVVVWFFSASIILGKGVFKLLGLCSSDSGWLTNFLVGAGCYGTGVGLLAHFPVNYPGLYGAALAIPIIIGWRWLYNMGRSWYAIECTRGDLGLDNLDFIVEILIASVALVHFVVALMPEVGHDALASHLFVPSHLLSRHQWGFDPSFYCWAVSPMLGDWIYSIGYMLGGESASRLINVQFIFVIAFLIRNLILWAGGDSRAVKWAVLLFLSTPLTFTESSSLFIESIWSSFVVAGTWFVLKICSSDEDNAFFIPVAGIFLGCALATKAVTFTVLPVLFLCLLCSYKEWTKSELLKSLTSGLVIFFLVGLIPYITAYVITDNPLFPFFNGYFKSPYYPPVNFQPPAIFEKGMRWDILYHMTFFSQKYLESKAGAAGFQWLPLFLPSCAVIAFSRWRRAVIMLFVSVMFVVLAFNQTSYLRYVFPSFAIFSAIIGLALSKYLNNGTRIRQVIVSIYFLVVGCNLIFLNAGAQYGDFNLNSIFASSSREPYLQSRLPIRNAVEVVNKLNRWRSPVAVFSSPLTAGLTADALYPTWYNHVFQRSINESATAYDMAEVLKAEAVTYVILDSNWGSLQKRDLILEVTQELTDLGYVTVRRLKNKYLFSEELLKNPSFSLIDGWFLNKGAIYTDNNELCVTVSSPATQTVLVTPGRRYANIVVAKSIDNVSQARVQVNWLDASSRFISTDIRVYDCNSKFEEHSMEVVAPPDAAYAIVYATGHTSSAIIFNRISFLQ